jgi:serine/threonine protein kinase
LARLHADKDSAGSLGWIHGDLTPEHVFDIGDGACFIDFGQCAGRRVDEPLAATEQGTLPYAAPERLRGEGASQAGDVYALAASACQLLASREGAAEGIEPADLVRLAERGMDRTFLERFVGADDGADHPLCRALAFEPAERPKASEVADALR